MPAALVHPHPADLQENRADKRDLKAAGANEILVATREIGYFSQAYRDTRIPATYAKHKSRSIFADCGSAQRLIIYRSDR
jgi:hypothetical protein